MPCRLPACRVLLLALLGLAAPAASAQRAPFQGLGSSRSGSSFSVVAVSQDARVVVGNRSAFVGTQQVTEAFRWTAATGIVGLGDLAGGQVRSIAAGVSADGAVVVGTSSGTNGDEVFRWTAAAGMVGLGGLAGSGSSDPSISADGSAVVGLSFGTSGQEAFRWTAPTGMVGLGDLPGGSFFSKARCVSADGTAVSGEGTNGTGRTEAFRWTATTGMVGLGTLPGRLASVNPVCSADGSAVVGASSGTSGSEAFRWTAAAGMVGLGDLPGGAFQSEATRVSADGTVVFGISDGSVRQEAFRWTALGGMVSLGRIPRFPLAFTGARAISADGTVAVGFSTNTSQSFFWTAAGGMQVFRAALVAALGPDSVAVAGWTGLVPFDVSADGRVVVGAGTNPQGLNEAWRAVLSTGFVVTRAGDEPDATPGDGRCDADAGLPGDQCTLRAAIREANLVAATEPAPRITFAIPGGPPVVAPVIAPGSPLPTLTRAMALDGTTQPGGLVGLDGALLSGTADGLRVAVDSVTVRGLAVTRFPGYGLHVVGAVGVRVAGNRLGVAAGDLPVGGLPAANRAGALRLAGAASAAIGGRDGLGPARVADRNVLFGPLVADAAARARVYLNTFETAAADAQGLALRAPLDVGDDGPTCGAWARTSGSVPAPPRVLELTPTLVRGLATPGDTVAVYRVAALGADNGRYWARRVEPLALVAADAAGAFAATVTLQPGDRVALTALAADGRTSELSQARRPVIFAPGIGGSWLRAADGTDLWLPLAPTDIQRNSRMTRIAMLGDGETSVEPVVATEVLENVGLLRIVYGQIHDRLGAAGYVGDPFNRNAATLDQWRFANDWRRSATVLADGFRALVDRVTTASGQSAASAARSCQTDVIAHSNGGVIASVYLRRDAAHARDRINRFVSSGTPYLGADQAVAAHTSGYIFGVDEILPPPLWIVAWGDMLTMTRNVPGAYGLLPSRAYFDAVDPTAPTYAHGYSVVDLNNQPVVGYEATTDFLTGSKVGAGGAPFGMGRNRALALEQDLAVHALIDDWRAYEGPPQIFRHVGQLQAQTEVGWFLGPGPATLSPLLSARDEPDDTDRHVAYRERLRPIFGWGDMTVPLLSATLGRSILVGDTDLSGVDESAWIEEFETFACAHGPLVEPGCRPVFGGGPEALDRLVDILASGSAVPAASTVASPPDAGPPEAAHGVSIATEVVYVMATAPVTVTVTDAAGRVTGPPAAAAPDAVQYGVPGVVYVYSRLGSTLALPAGGTYTVRVTSASPGAVVTLLRQRVTEAAVTQVLYADQPLAAGGTLTLVLAAAGTPAETPWARDADGNGTPDGTVAPAAVLPGTASVPALPFPQPSAVDVGAATAQDVRTATLRLPDTGTAGWTFALAESAPWLSLSATAGTSPASVTLTLDPAGLPDGPVSTDLALTLTNGGYTFRATVPVTLRVGVAVAGEPGAPPEAPPAVTALDAPAPNPAGGRALVRYRLAAAGPVRVTVTDLLGREVAVLADGERAAGAYETVLDAGRLAPGLYVVRLRAGAYVGTRRLVIAR